MKTLILFILLLLSFNVQSQEIITDYNLGLENISSTRNFPSGWLKWGTDYLLNIDSAVKSEGNYSMRIEPGPDTKAGSFGSVAYRIPVRFEGKKIKLKGKMKLENVTDGPAGLIMRIDGKDDMLQFDNMNSKKIMGTMDWTEYSIELPLDSNAMYIFVGGLLQGKGTMWLDDLSITIDDVDISQVKIVEPKFTKAELDNEFDYVSGISINNLTEQQTNNLFITGRVWGFLKYYHPNITESEYKWDYELFRILPKILNAAGDDDRNKVLLDWINSLGAITEFKPGESAEVVNVKLAPDLDWIKDKSTFGDELVSQFEKIRTAKYTSRAYVELYPEIGNPKFKNELKFADANMDDGFRLLALFRYWNMIQYFFPDKHLIGEDWNNVLREFIPKFVNEKSELDYRLNSLKLIARIHDTHANIWSYEKLLEDYWGNYLAPADITFIEEKPIVTSYLYTRYDMHKENKPALKIGDEIISLNGKPVENLIKERLPLTCASNYPTQLREIQRRFFYTNDSALTVGIKRDGKTETVQVKCYPVSNYDFTDYWNILLKKNIRSWKLINEDIGYIMPSTIKNDSLEFIMNKFKDTKGIIIDFRSYPGDFFVFALGKYLLPKPKSFVKFTTGSLDYPGLFTVNDYTQVGDTNPNYYKGKVIIIVDETTQSSAEYHTMALRTAPNAKVIGSTTAGADGNVSEIFLPGGIRTMISGIGVLTPDGKETQRIGIVPDVEVKPTIKGFREGKDEPLIKAIELIEKK